MLTLSHCFLCLQVLPPCIFLNYTYPACFLLHILPAPVPKFLLFPFHFTICTIAQLFPALILVFFQTWPPHFLLTHLWLSFISLKVLLSIFNPSTPTHSLHNSSTLHPKPMVLSYSVMSVKASLTHETSKSHRLHQYQWIKQEHSQIFKRVNLYD